MHVSCRYYGRRYPPLVKSSRKFLCIWVVSIIFRCIAIPTWCACIMVNFLNGGRLLTLGCWCPSDPRRWQQGYCMMTSWHGNAFRITVCLPGGSLTKGWKHFPRKWPFVRGIHRGPVNSPHKGQWRGALMFSLICVWTNGWVNNGDADDLRRHRAHYDVIVM